MSIVQRVTGIRCVVGGNMAAGWSPAGRGLPLRKPVREVTLVLEIEDDNGVVLLIVSSDDPTIWCDDYFGSVEEAKSTAATWYGVRPEQWVDASAG